MENALLKKVKELERRRRWASLGIS
jgi:hypothetical protein